MKLKVWQELTKEQQELLFENHKKSFKKNKIDCLTDEQIFLFKNSTLWNKIK